METLHQIYDRFYDGLQLPHWQEDGAERTSFRPSVGEGFISRVATYSGMVIVHSDYRFNQDHTIRVSSDMAMIELSFCLQGNGGVNVSGNEFDLVADTCYLHLMKNFDATFAYNKEKPTNALAIGIPLPLFAYYIENTEGHKRVQLSDLLGENAYRLFTKEIDPKAALILREMIDCPYSHSMRKLFMESKAMELAAIYLQAFLYERELKSTATGLSKSDMEKIRLAKEKLLERMDAPPSLLELSRMVGLNDYKLKIGFKEQFGNTVFGYLREKRMERARHLLQEGTASVSQAASLVGYANFSHFAEAFRKQYGINPSQLLRQRY